MPDPEPAPDAAPPPYDGYDVKDADLIVDPPGKADRFGEILVQRAPEAAPTVEEALREQKQQQEAGRTPERIGEILERKQAVDRGQVAEILDKQRRLREESVGRALIRFGQALLRHDPDASGQLQRAIVDRLAAVPPGTADADALQQVVDGKFLACFLAPIPPLHAPKAAAPPRSSSRLEVAALKDARGILTVNLRGVLDSYTTQILEAALEKWLSAPPVRCVVDCARLDYLNSQGVTVLIQYADAFREKKGDLVLCGLGTGPKEVIQRLGLDQFFRIHPDVKSAAEELSRREGDL